MRPFNTNEDEILTEGQEYDIGQNDGRVFSKVIFKGTKNYCGKNMMCFEDENGSQITVNVSYNSFTIEENGQFPTPEDLNQKENNKWEN